MGTIINEFEWDARNVDHMLVRHNVRPEEVEEAAFSDLAYWEHGRTGRYYLLGRTDAGRYLFAVVQLLGHGKARVITARDMSGAERRRWRRRRG